jgi:ABC-type polysaccharide/polyol phosphate export permease
MRKKYYALLFLALISPFLVLYERILPIEVAGHRPGNVLMLMFYIGFIAATTAMVLVLFVIIITKKSYVTGQLTTLSKFRHLLFLMIKRDFVSRYRRSVLGILWSLLNPMLTMLVLTMVFSLLFRFEIENFPVYLLSGQLMFNFYAEATNSAMTSITGGAGIIKKIYVPKYIFPVSRVISALVNVGFSLMAFLIVFVVTGESFKWTMLLIPLPIFYLFLFSAGVGMFLSAASVFFKDISYLYGVFLTLLMFLTPIMYPVSILPDRIFHLLHLNPLFHYVGYFRELALSGNVPGPWSNIICLGFALAALGVGFYVKMSQQDKYILYL